MGDIVTWKDSIAVKKILKPIRSEAESLLANTEMIQEKINVKF